MPQNAEGWRATDISCISIERSIHIKGPKLTLIEKKNPGRYF